MLRKAQAGHVTGGRVFGYDNVEVLADGKRSHVERRINEAEAAVVRRIFELSASGAGLTRIAKTLNAEGAPAPRPQQGRPTGWVAEHRARSAAPAALSRRDRLEPDAQAGRRGRVAAVGPPGRRRVAARGGARAADRV